LKGVLGKWGGLWWFFDGENVVECVVKRGEKTSPLRGGKMGQVF
jgi:hypothetical protein